MSLEVNVLPDEACPTVEDARFIIGVGKRPMNNYTGGAGKDERLHPSEVLGLAELAHEDGRLEIPYNQIAARLITYGTVHCPDLYPGIVDDLEGVMQDFLQNRTPVSRPLRFSVALKELFTMDIALVGRQAVFIERGGDTYF